MSIDSDFTDGEAFDKTEEMTKELLPFIAPIVVFKDAESGPDGWLTGGTVGLIESPTTRFIVTAAHIIDKYSEIKEKHPSAVIFMGGGAQPINISTWRVIDIDSSMTPAVNSGHEMTHVASCLS